MTPGPLPPAAAGPAPATALETARGLLAGLVQGGLRHLVLAPGSRNAPLVYAAVEAEARGELQLSVRTDERVAGFLALGLAAGQAAAAAGRAAPAAPASAADPAGPAAPADPAGAAAGRWPGLGPDPAGAAAGRWGGLAGVAATSGAAAGRWGGLAGVATTSGTAVANLHPAVMEAAEARLPLIAISADRPAELHGVGANQTTDQRGVFGAAPVWARTLPAGLDPALAQAAGLAAAAAAVGERSGLPGPAHLNIQFREPLVPQPGWWPAPGGPGAAPPPGAGPPLGPVGAPGAGGAPPPGPAGGLANQAAQLLPAALERGPKTLVLAGFGAGPAAAELALAAGWPLVADPASGAWWGPNCVPAGRLAADLLGSQVERVVVYGRPVLSRPVARLAQQPGLETVIVHPGGGPWFDLGRVARRVASAALAPSGPPTGQERAWLDRWLQAGRAAWARVAARPFPSGPAIAACVAQAAGAGRLVVGASSAIRDLDLVPAPAGPSGLVAAMRGAAGIDGTISFAAGLDLAAPGPGPTRVLLGDLALAHDSGGLLLPTSETRPNLQVIVLQDGGGGIFETLEVAGPGLEAAFERFFATPVQLEVKALARACGAAFAEVSTERDLVAALACPPAGISLVSVRLPRAARRGADADAVRLSRNDLILPSELS